MTTCEIGTPTTLCSRMRKPKLREVQLHSQGQQSAPVHAHNLGALGSGSTGGHLDIDLLGRSDHPGLASLFPVWWERMWFQGSVNLCGLCHSKSLATRTNPPPHQKQKKKWVESHLFLAGIYQPLPEWSISLGACTLNLSQSALTQCRALGWPRRERHSQGPTLMCGVPHSALSAALWSL